MTITTYRKIFNSNTLNYDEVIETFAEGVTLVKGSRDARIMSDVWDTEVYALYWDEVSQSIKSIGLYYAYESDRFECQSTAVVDATPEVWEKVRAFYEAQEYHSLESEAKNEAERIVKDSLVKVVRGRQNKGAEGKVVAVISRPYGMGYRSVIEDKLGVATSDVMIDKVVGKKVFKNHRDVVWVWARNCDLTVTPAIDIESIRKNAQVRANSRVEGLKAGRRA